MKSNIDPPLEYHIEELHQLQPLHFPGALHSKNTLQVDFQGPYQIQKLTRQSEKGTGFSLTW